MSGTRRVPLARHSAAQITPTALDGFRRLVALETECTGPPDCQPYQRCGACEDWWRMQSVIHRELSLKPWEFAVEREGTGDWPADEGARARWKLFEEAAREPEPRQGRRKRARRSRAEAEPVV